MKGEEEVTETIWDAYNRVAQDDPWMEEGTVNWGKAITGVVGLVISMWVWIEVAVPWIANVLVNG